MRTGRVWHEDMKLELQWHVKVPHCLFFFVWCKRIKALFGHEYDQGERMIIKMFNIVGLNMDVIDESAHRYGIFVLAIFCGKFRNWILILNYRWKCVYTKFSKIKKIKCSQYLKKITFNHFPSHHLTRISYSIWSLFLFLSSLHPTLLTSLLLCISSIEWIKWLFYYLITKMGLIGK